MDFEQVDLTQLDRETLEKLAMILNLQQLDITNAKFKEEMRLMRERFEKENEQREVEQKEREAAREAEQKQREAEQKEREAAREAERLRWEVDLQLRRERHEREMEKMRAEVDKISNESRKVRIEWLLAPILAGASAAGVLLMAMKFMN